MPESALDFRQVGLVEESPVAWRLQTNAANFNIQRVFLGSYQQVRTNGAQLAINLVANISGHRNHRRCHRNAKRDGCSGQQFAPLLATKGFVNKADEHPLLLFEHAATCRDVRLLNDHGIGRLRRLQRNRIAAPCRSHRLRINGSGAVLANHSIGRFIKSHPSANLAGIEHRRDFSVRLLIEPETNFCAVLLSLEAVQVAVGDLRQWNLYLTVGEADCRGRRKGALALGIDKLRGQHGNKHERENVDRGHPQALPARRPGSLAALRCRNCIRHGLALLRVKQNHQRRESQNRYEKEKIIPYNRPDQRHLTLGRRNHTTFRKLINCDATRKCIAVVTRKNFCKLIRTLPFTNITPKAIATIPPSSVPRKLISSVEFSVTAERIRTVSAPSRSTIKKTKKNSPIHASFPASNPTLPSISPFILRPVFIMKITMVTTKKAATSMTHPSNTSSFRFSRESRIATPMLPANAAPSAAYTAFRRSLRPIFDR